MEGIQARPNLQTYVSWNSVLEPNEEPGYRRAEEVWNPWDRRPGPGESTWTLPEVHWDTLGAGQIPAERTQDRMDRKKRGTFMCDLLPEYILMCGKIQDTEEMKILGTKKMLRRLRREDALWNPADLRRVSG